MVVLSSSDHRPINRPVLGHEVEDVGGVVEGDMAAPAEAAEGVHDGALGVAGRVGCDGAVGGDLGLKQAGRGGRQLGEQLVAEAGGGADQGGQHLLGLDLAEHGLQVAAIEFAEVFKLDEVEVFGNRRGQTRISS